ncbi:hypothetical protein NitYY0826_C0750 [Nitratiruptor sp. YY08-26]|uniref:hypothetical protein n=1 Tax=unclassified Nitratiruptor TaxID=2624044 RepID=UPI001915923B|nr:MULTISPECIES: hypothetical protein [unclassified Nitratiruptor]BCD61887.1 hypothetical protein NitYY0813_C0748 [Nitratiruptor sp. YY08-13]BCD65822.1 hypothetical protein NitYY0826_C0750 [Nitratiruptor sp. YY08-26]
MNVQELLKDFIELLKEENELLINSVKDKDVSSKLMKVVEQKEKLLHDILALEKEDVEQFTQELRLIDEWTERNRSLAVNNIEFINDIFDAIYAANAPTKYTKDGNISTSKEGFFNKKV